MRLQLVKTYKNICHIAGALLFVILLATETFSPEIVESQETKATWKVNTFRMAINRPRESPLYRWVELIYTEVFSRLNIKLEVESYPLKRASTHANTGKVDGEPARIYSYATSYPNLVRVEESVFSMTVVAYTADPSTPELNGWKSLKNTDYLIEYPHGMKICEDNLSKVVKPEQLRSISESHQGLAMLADKRIDLYVDDLNATAPLVHDPKLQLQNKVRVVGVMESIPLYMYVYKRHQSMTPQLATIIKTMKSEGLIEQYRKTAFGISNH